MEFTTEKIKELMNEVYLKLGIDKKEKPLI